MGRSFGLRSPTVVNILASASIGIDRQPIAARAGDGMPECGKRLIQGADDFQERPLRPSHQLKHASRTKRSLGWSNDKARTGGRIRHGWLPICQLMNNFGGYCELTHRGEIQNACARIGRSRVLSNRLVKRGQQFIRVRPSNRASRILLAGSNSNQNPNVILATRFMSRRTKRAMNLDGAAGKHDWHLR